MTNSGVIGRPVIGTPLDGSGEIGVISAFALTTAPIGWIICNGASLLRAGTYVNLFDVIGTGWGTVDGSHFNLPDLRGSFLRGTGAHGTHDTAQGSSNKFTGPSVAAFSDDLMQNHEHDLHSFTAANTSRPMSNNGSGNATVAKLAQTGDATGSGAYWYGTKNMRGSADSDSAHTAPGGVPRTGYETKPFNAGVNYCIKF